MMATFDDIMVKAKEAFDIAGKKTEEVVAYSKLKIASATVSSDLNKAYQRLGTIVYDMTKHDLNEPELVDRCIEEIDLLKEHKEEIKEQMAAVKKARICPSCGKSCCKDAFFCPSCGAVLDEEE